MNLQRLGKKLRAELLRNPKKTAVLGLVLLVALYFWAPLIWAWVAPSSGSAVTPAVAATSHATPFPVASSEIKEETLTWKALAELREQEAFTKPVSWEGRDPFAPISPPEPVVLEQAAPRQVEKTREITEEDLSLELTATIVGKKGQRAFINGRTYRLFDEVADPALAGPDGNPLEFTIIAIEPRSIMLRRNETTYMLSLRSPEVVRYAWGEPDRQAP